MNQSQQYTNSPRIPIKDVYTQTIIPLLDDAKDMLYKNTDTNFQAGRVCAASAAGLLAKVYACLLYTSQLLLDSSYFVPWLFPCKIRTFAPVRYTERPIVAAAKLREGKFVILVNGSPSALILPTLFLSLIHIYLQRVHRPVP